ncbi:SpoIIE family protein phosphatase [Yinghuangia sp. YIM S09857]|uniref:ATP-binding SpoIIE family protein phosphatase n=1 Tax=Yinghuangia sp. YIM S09857 TaxID=3436929 RepID=UPI003F53B7A6
MFDLANLTASDLVVCGSDLRQATAAATTPEEAARALARLLRGAFADPGAGTPQIGLVRVYATARPKGGDPGDRVLELLSGDGEFTPGHPGAPDLIPLAGPGAPAPLHPALDAVLRDLGICGDATPRGGVPALRAPGAAEDVADGRAGGLGDGPGDVPPGGPQAGSRPPGPPGLPAGLALSEPGTPATASDTATSVVAVPAAVGSAAAPSIDSAVAPMVVPADGTADGVSLAAGVGARAGTRQGSDSPGSRAGSSVHNAGAPATVTVVAAIPPLPIPAPPGAALSFGVTAPGAVAGTTAGTTAGTAFEAAPETVGETIGQAIGDTVTETVPATLPETVPLTPARHAPDVGVRPDTGARGDPSPEDSEPSEDPPDHGPELASSPPPAPNLVPLPPPPPPLLPPPLPALAHAPVHAPANAHLPPPHTASSADPAQDADAVRHAIAHIPDQMAALHGTRTVLGYAGTLPDGELFAVLLYSGHHIPAAAAEALRGLTAATRLALLPAPQTPVPTPRTGQMAAARLDALEQLLAATEDTTVEQARTVETYRGRVRTQAEQLRINQRRLEQEAHIVETLYGVGQQLTRELDLDKLVQTATDAATKVIAAEHGILLYRDCDRDDGLDDIRHAAAARGDSAHPLLPDPGVRLTPAHLAEDVVRSGDVAEHPGRWHAAPVAVDPEALPVRSYLGVPVVSREGKGLGAFAFSHSKPDIFTERDEQLALGIASQAAAAIENARLYRSVRDTAVRLQRSLLPPELPDIEALEIACRYLPGARGSQVGGDWFDVIPLSAGRVALVIGDVMGRGLAAAAVMGQLRTAVRAYAVMDLPPAQVMRHLNRLMAGMGAEDQITTCVYAVYDPWHDSVRWSNAGHLPPALIGADGGVRLLDDDLGVPLGVEGTAFEDADVVFRPCDRLLLYTDGLVERHDVSLTERLQLFTAEVGGAARNPDGVQDTCDRLMGGMLTGREHDDVALLLVRAREGRERAAALELPPTAKAAREARGFVRSVLAQWRLPGLGEAACSVVTELVANAVEHARTPMELRLGHRPGRLVVQVADHDGRLPRRLSAAEGDERHRGLMIVAALAADWGVRPTDTGKVVWAELVEPG